MRRTSSLEMQRTLRKISHSQSATTMKSRPGIPNSMYRLLLVALLTTITRSGSSPVDRDQTTIRGTIRLTERTTKVSCKKMLRKLISLARTNTNLQQSVQLGFGTSRVRNKATSTSTTEGSTVREINSKFSMSPSCTSYHRTNRNPTSQKSFLLRT